MDSPKVDRCLARYSPGAEADNAIPCNTVRYNTIKSFPHPTVGAPSASNIPSALGALAGKND